MRFRPFRFVPAVPYALALLAGLAAGRRMPEVAGWGVAAFVAPALAALLAAAPRTRRAARLAACVACIAVAAARGASVHRSREARLDAWGGRGAPTSDAAFEARVERSPERAKGGGTVFRALVRRQGRPAGDPWLELRVRIAASPPEAETRLLALRHGDRLAIWGRVRLPGSADPAERRLGARLAAEGLDGTAWVKSARLVERRAVGRGSVLRLVDVARAELGARLAEGCGPGRASAVLAAMLLGERHGLDEADARALRDSGLYHLLSISGINVAWVSLVLLLVLERTSLPRSVRLATAAAGLAAFTLLVGADPPVLRAATAAVWTLVGRWLGREGEAVNTLALVAALLALHDPAALDDPGFRLSFLATAGILLLARRIERALPFPAWAATSMAVSTSAYLATVPVMAATFGALAPIAVLTNVGGGLLAAWLLGWGYLALVIAPLPLVGPAAAWCACRGAEVLLGLAHRSAELPGAGVRVAVPPTAAWTAYLLLLVVAPALTERRLRRATIATIAILLVAFHQGRPPYGGEPLAAVLDVGQGQSVLVATREGAVLVDAGGTSGGRFDAGDRIVVPFLASKGLSRIDVLLVSHDHDDHLGGAFAILHEREVGEIWIGPGSHRDARTRDLVAAAVARGAAVRLAGRGARARRAGLRIEVLHPDATDAARPVNDRCLVARITTAAGRAMLVPGDLEAGGEAALVARGAEALRAEILVAGHHGAARSSTAAFLDAVRPREAAISVGRGNRFGHPAPATLSRFRARGVEPRRTDREGTVLWNLESGSVESDESQRERDETGREDERE